MSDGRFTWPVRVYYEDTDAGQLVYHANYLKFMERARTEWLRSFGYDQTQLRHKKGVLFVVTRLDMRYHRAARLDDELSVALQVIRMGRAGFDLDQSIHHADGGLICSAAVRIGCLDAAEMAPRRIPDSLLTELRIEH